MTLRLPFCRPNLDSTSARQSVTVIGKESVGKSALVRRITGNCACSQNFRGTTIAVQESRTDEFVFYDTPGVIFDEDTTTTQLALKQLATEDRVILVCRAEDLENNLQSFLPLLKNKRGLIVVTFLDRLSRAPYAEATLPKLRRAIGVDVIGLDARRIQDSQIAQIRDALRIPKEFPDHAPTIQTGWEVAPTRSLFDIPILRETLALGLLLFPAWLAVQNCNRTADLISPTVSSFILQPITFAQSLPSPLRNMLAGDYGLLAMMPFLIIYAAPTVFVFAILVALYKASGLIDRITVALNPFFRPFGLGARDVVRVIMGFGCNVPAIVNTRACSVCSRRTCVSAVSFGSACSYQLPATLAVFAAAEASHLTIPFLFVLAITTLIYVRAIVPTAVRTNTSQLLLPKREPLQRPDWRIVVAESKSVINEFISKAFPIFVLICLVASLLEWSGIINVITRWAEPFMKLFDLPGTAAGALIMGSIRKDGIAIGLLENNTALKVPLQSDLQILTIVYLSGVLLPCAVTTITICREMGIRTAISIVSRQAVAAIMFSLMIVWGGKVLHL